MWIRGSGWLVSATVALLGSGFAAPAAERKPAAAAAPVSSAQASRAAAPDAQFGGDGVELFTSFAGVRLELPCAYVVSPAPIRPGPNGEVVLDATFVPEGPGPEPEGGRPGRALRITGRLSGDSLTVSGAFTDGKETFGPFTLVKDRRVRVVKCK